MTVKNIPQFTIKELWNILSLGFSFFFCLFYRIHLFHRIRHYLIDALIIIL